MAIGGALVKNIFVRIRTDGAAQAKGEMDDIAARAKQIGSMDPSVKLSVDDKAAVASLAAFRLELAALKGAGDQAGLQDLAARLKAVGDSADAPRAKMSALRLELQAAKSAAGLAANAIGGGGGGGAAGGGGLLGSIASSIGPWGIAALAAGGLASGIQGIVPAAAAAAISLGAFGAFALPTLRAISTGWSAVNTAVSNYQAASATLDVAIHRSAADLAAYHATIRGVEPDLRSAAELLTRQTVQWQNLSPAMQKNVIALSNNSAELRKLLPDQRAALSALLAQASAWNALPAAQRPLAAGLQALDTQFQKLVATMAPLTLSVFNEGIKIASTLLPDLLPFAQAAGHAIDGLLKGFEAFAKSPGFKEWQQQMLQLTGPTITTLGEGLGQIAIALGKFLIALANPEALRTFKYLLEAVAVIITGLAVAVEYSTKGMIIAFHAVAVAFDWVRHEIAAGWDALSSAITSRLGVFTTWWHSHWAEISTVAASAWHIIVEVARVAWAAIDLLLHAGLPVLEGIWKAAWAVISGVVSTAWHVITGLFAGGVHMILDIVGIALDLLTLNWSKAWRDLNHLTSDAIHAVTGTITSLVSGFGHLLWNAGAALIRGLIGGIQSMIGSLGGAVAGIAQKVAGFFGLSPAIEGPLSGGGAPFIRGQHFTADIAAGIAAETARVRASAAQVAAAAAAGPAGRGYAAGPAVAGTAALGSGRWIEARVEFRPTGNAVIDAIAAGMKLYIKDHGGGGATNSVQRALGLSY